MNTPKYTDQSHTQRNKWIPHPGPQTEAFRYFHVDEILYGGAKGGGKAQPIYSKVLTVTGWKRIDEICVGDKVITPEGTVSNVLGVYPQGKEQIYELLFIDNSVARATKDHLWKARWIGGNGWQTVTTQHLIGRLNKISTQKIKPNILIPLCEPVEMTTTDTKIDAYVLGLLLGDGYLGKTAVRFSTLDRELVEYIEQHHTINKMNDTECDYSITKSPELNRALREYGLWNKQSDSKFIPREYIDNCIDVRLGVLQGLIDTDGYVDKRGHISFCSVSKQLALDVQEIVRSLGGNATLKEKAPQNPRHKIAYNVYIGIDVSVCLSRLKRKRDRIKPYNGGHKRCKRLIGIKKVGIEHAKCIKIDSEHGLYITDDYIVTHNTDWLLFDFIEPELIKKPHYRGIIFRRTFPRLREVIDRSHQWFRRLPNPPEYSKNDRCWTFPTGAKLFFAHCQYEESKYDYQGHEYHYMGFDQVEEFTLSQVEFLLVQCRTTDPGIHIRIRSTANPGNVGHLWVKRRWIDKKEPMQVYKNELGLTSMYIPAKVYDNPALIENDPMYVKRLEALPEQDRKALLEGDWNIFHGQYFKEWTPQVHIIEPHGIPKYWKKFIAGDFGHTAPTSVGWYAIDEKDNLYRYREIYEEGLYYDTLAEKICNLSYGEDIDYGVFDPSIFGDRQHHKKAKEGLSGAEVMQEIINDTRGEDGFLIMRADNRRIEGWRKVKQLLKIENGESKFKSFSTCTQFNTIFPANIHDSRKPEDVDTQGEDHNADELRYAIMSLKGEETTLDRPEAYNPNSAWGRYMQAKHNPEEYIYEQ